VKIEGDVEAWLEHRVIAADVKKGPDLVIVIADIHDNAAAVDEQLGLVDRILESRAGSDLIIATELAPHEVFPKRTRTPAEALREVIEKDPRRFWGVEDVALRQKAIDVMVKMEDKRLAPQQHLALTAEMRKVERPRSEAMAMQVMKKLGERQPGGKPRIVLFPVGAAHVADVLETLRKSGKVSTIGLMPNHLTDSLAHIAKPAG
jgi:hypothetical protein